MTKQDVNPTYNPHSSSPSGAFQKANHISREDYLEHSETALFDQELFGDLELDSSKTSGEHSLVGQTIGPSSRPKITSSVHTTQASFGQLSTIPSSNPAHPSPHPKRGRFLLLMLLFAALCGGGYLGYTQYLQVPPQQEPQTQKREIHITTKPAGARVWIDQKPTKLRTPCTFTLEHSRRYVLKLQKAKYYPQLEQIFVDDAPKRLSRHYNLRPQNEQQKAKLGFIQIQCQTEEAKLLLLPKGSNKKLPPPIACLNTDTKVSLPPGKYTLIAEKDGFRKLTQEIEIVPEQTFQFQVNLQPLEATLPRVGQAPQRPFKSSRRRRRRRKRTQKYVTLHSTPRALVRWGRKTLGMTPLTHKFPTGKHTLIFESPKLYSQVRKTIYVKKRGPEKISVLFGKGTFRFSVFPWANVYLNGKKIGQTPIRPYKAW
ncbi:MAG: PEGA domain-containing protein, partial [Myxococcota bacterium]